MASGLAPRRHTSAMHTFESPPKPRSRGYSVAPDTIDDILGMCLNWVLPMLFFCVIIILVTMLTTYTLMMRRRLPRVFTFVVVITFSVLITITFFLLVTFHIRRCQRVRYTLSETFTKDGYHGPRSSCHSSDALLRAAQGSRAVHPSIPLKEIKRQARVRQETQSRDFKTAPVVMRTADSFHGSTQAPPSRHSSFVVGENEPLWPSTPQRLPPLIIPSSSSFDGPLPPFVPFVPEPPKEVPVYYLPPGPLSPLPSAGFRPMWADDLAQQIAANQSASTPEKSWKFWSK